MKEWHFYDRVYRIWVTLCIGTIEELYLFLDNLGYKFTDEVKEEPPMNGYHIRIKLGDCTTDSNMSVIWMAKYSADTLIHELTHVVTRTFSDKGVPISDENTEAMAFYMEYWYHEMTRIRKRFPDGRPPKLAKT